MYKVFLSLGSNLGDRENNLLQAVVQINNIDGIKLDAASNIYETEPVGYLQQGSFLNMVFRLYTSIEPLELLERLQGVEQALKRTREIHWGPRTIDIDILMIDSLRLELEGLTVPHPRMYERAFVLIPLRDLLDQSQMQGIDVCITKCEDCDGVMLYKNSSEVFQHLNLSL